tara:strand:+ start:190 stop:504 length:315 start_codon:yes stop_codon:yes gene_type:complete
MSNKYIDVICSENYGAVDQKQVQSAGLGLLLGAAAVVGIPFYLIASETSERQGSRMFDWFKKREERRAQADKKSMQTLMQGKNRMSNSSKQQQDEIMRRMFSAM